MIDKANFIKKLHETYLDKLYTIGEHVLEARKSIDSVSSSMPVENRVNLERTLTCIEEKLLGLGQHISSSGLLAIRNLG